jgi:hypothetical protein
MDTREAIAAKVEQPAALEALAAHLVEDALRHRRSSRAAGSPETSRSTAWRYSRSLSVGWRWK